MNTGSLRRGFTWAVLALMPALVAGCCPGSVFIADPGLETALRRALNEPLGGLSAAELASITELNAEGLGIVSLEGLEYCTALTVLNLRDNDIVSISPLTDLPNLVRVDLTNNRVRNIEAIAGWENLNELLLAGDFMEIFDWSPLAANVNAARGLGAGDVVVLPRATTVNDDNNPLPNFASAYQALQAAEVRVLFGTVETI
jgi:hypothetical protein